MHQPRGRIGVHAGVEDLGERFSFVEIETAEKLFVPGEECFYDVGEMIDGVFEMVQAVMLFMSVTSVLSSS